jgi:hypothetical protein
MSPGARVFAVSCGLLLLASSGHAGDVVVVKPLEADGVPLLQVALETAADGDIIILHNGNYLAPDSTPFVIDGKGVSVVVDEGHGPIIVRGFRVVNTPPASLVFLRGLEMRAWDPGTHNADLPLRGIDVEGSLWVEDCVLQGEDGVLGGLGGVQQAARPAVVLQSCSSVTIERCTILGGDGHDALVPQSGFSPGAAGLAIHDTSLTMHDSSLRGGDSGTDYLSGSAGGDGLRVTTGSWAVLSGCTAVGGDVPTSGFSPKPTGDGVQVLADGSMLWSRGNAFAAGDPFLTAPSGLPLNAPASAVTTYTTFAPSALMPAVVRVGQLATLELHGRPGDAAFVLLSLGGGFFPVPELQDALVLNVAQFVGPRFLGSIGDFGSLTLEFTAPFLPPGTDGVLVLVQPVLSGFGGYNALGAGTGFLLVQTAF